MAQIEIGIGSEFDNEQGEFPNYDTYDNVQRTQLTKQAHVDIRTFVQNDIVETQAILFMNLNNMATLDTMTMATLEGAVAVRRGEHWTVGTVGKQTDRNNWNGLSLSCSVGTNTTSSVLLS